MTEPAMTRPEFYEYDEMAVDIEAGNARASFRHAAEYEQAAELLEKAGLLRPARYCKDRGPHWLHKADEALVRAMWRRARMLDLLGKKKKKELLIAIENCETHERLPLDSFLVEKLKERLGES